MPRLPARTHATASAMPSMDERLCVPVCTILLYLRANSTMRRPSLTLCETGFSTIDVFAGLDGPDGCQRVPVIRRGDGDRIHVLALEQLADIGESLHRLIFVLEFLRFGIQDGLSQSHSAVMRTPGILPNPRYAPAAPV